MEKRVVITGMGVVSPVGNSVEEFWSNLVSGKCGISYLDEERSKDLKVMVAATINDFDPIALGLDKTEVRKNDRFCQMAMAAAIQAVTQSGLVTGENIDSERLGVYVGSGIGGLETFTKETQVMLEEGANRVSPTFVTRMIVNMAGANIAIKYNAQGPCQTCVSACATGTSSVGEAFRAIKDGYADAIIAGGAEAPINPLSLACFSNAKALTIAGDPAYSSLPFSSDRAGFVMGEGSGILVLEEYEHAKARGANIIAEVTGYGHTCDAYHVTAPAPGAPMAAKAISQALQQSDAKEGEAIYINAHGTGTQMNDLAETLAIKQALGDKWAHEAVISSTKSMMGHALGAAGALELVVASLVLQRGVVPPTIGLTNPDPELDLDYTPLKARDFSPSIAISNSLGFGGHNAVVALRKL